MVEVETKAQWDTEYSADSVEWCPVSPYRHMLVCGTYQLVEGQEQNAASRHGRLHLMALINSEQVLERLETLEMPAVLDCQWAPQRVEGKVLLAVADAVGHISVFSLAPGDECTKPSLIEECRAELARKEGDPELLALSLDWSVSAGDVLLLASDSRGCISLLQLTATGLSLKQNWKAHQFEAWIAHFDTFNPEICYTGGDDCKLRVYDQRRGIDSACLTISTHSAGVTSLACRRELQHSLLSGSYDEQVLLWDTRQMKRALQSQATGGGVWRLRWKPHTEDFILAACMYNGFHVLDTDLGSVSEYKVHQSIAYGAGWTHLDATDTEGFPTLLSDNTTLIATCSFYDHLLCISSVKQIKQEH